MNQYPKDAKEFDSLAKDPNFRERLVDNSHLYTTKEVLERLSSEDLILIAAKYTQICNASTDIILDKRFLEDIQSIIAKRKESNGNY